MTRLKLYFELMRLHQPVGVWLLFWPCAWGISLSFEWGLAPNPAASRLALPGWEASGFLWEHALLLSLFFLGSVAMRGAGCIVNDLWDRDFDAQVARTRTRPLASGVVTVPQALLLLALLLLLSLWIVTQLPLMVFWLACASLPLVVLYPAMKRITWWPQAFLGLTFNFGALMGWAAARGTVDAPALWLYAAGFFWTLGYDTIYAHQDKTDDARIGIKSTARLLGAQTRLWVAGFFAAMLACLWRAGVPLLALALLAIPLMFQIARMQVDNPVRCGAQFRFHALYGGLIWAMIFLV